MRKLGEKGVNQVQVEHFDNLVKEFSEVFDGKLGAYKFETVKLKLKPNATPIFCKPRPIPMAYKAQVELELERLQKDEIITPIETSLWGTPLVPVLKADGTFRVCADYKTTLNRFLEEVKYPLPRIEEIFASLQGGVEFSKIDLSQAYNQFLLDEESAKLVTWSTHKGLFRVNRLPFGIAPAAAIFQRNVEQLLQGIPGVCNFLDDFIVTGADRVQHMENLKRVFRKLFDAGLKVKLEKCSFFQPEICYHEPNFKIY